MTNQNHAGGQLPGHSSLTYSRIVEEVTSTGLTQADLGRVVGASLRTVQNWASGASTPSGVKMKRLLDVQYLIGELREVYTDEGIQIWLNARNRNLAGERPIDLLLGGQAESVLREAQRLSGAM